MQPGTAAKYRPRFFAFREQEDNLENQFTQDTPFTELEQLRMKVTLTSCAHPEYGEVTIPFPIPDEDYDHTMELLRGLDIGDTLAQDCQIVRVESEYPVLTQLEGTRVNVDELDYLTRRMNCLYGDEETQFLGMAHKMKLSRILSTWLPAARRLRSSRIFLIWRRSAGITSGTSPMAICARRSTNCGMAGRQPLL